MSEYEHLLLQAAGSIEPMTEPDAEEVFVFDRGDIEGNECEIEGEVDGDDGGDDDFLDFND